MFSRFPGWAGSLLYLGPGAGFQVPRFSSRFPGSNLYSTNPLQVQTFTVHCTLYTAVHYALYRGLNKHDILVTK